MKLSLLLVILICTISTVLAQAYEPVQWEFTTKQINKNTFEIHVIATIDYEWQIYAQTSPEGGALPTQIEFHSDSPVAYTGKIKEIGNLERKYEEVFGIVTEFYRDSVAFVQVVKLKTDSAVTVKGTVNFMACRNDQCLPPKTLKFSIILQ